MARVLAILRLRIASVGAVDLIVHDLGAQHRLQVSLHVRRKALALFRAQQVDCEVGDDHQRLRNAHEALGELRVALAHDHLAREAKRSVEPRVPHAAAVGLDADLQHAPTGDLGVGTQPQAGRVGMGTDDGHPGATLGRELAAHDERHHVGTALRDEVLAALAQRPRFAVHQLFEAARTEQLGTGGHGVVGRACLIRKVHEEPGCIHNGPLSGGHGWEAL
mmetsp:Transcript_38574/g.99679  ORF Transcript_38574/g.99679 Transcript_38574/m.99679 type:complete len:220 (+) Transcript_38574:823-1482(+)